MTRMNPTVLAILAAAATASAGCLTPADGRARRDETIGRATIAGAEVTVDDGLAAVRGFGGGELTLWAQAPSLTIRLRLEAGAPAEWLLVVRNALPDASLDARAGDGSPLAVVAEASPFVTQRHWRVTGAPPGELVLRVAPPDATDLAPWRFAAFADVQDAIDDVGDIYSRMAADPAIRFVVMAGDLTEMGSAGEFERFERELEALPIPVYATLGNHDLGTRDDLFHDYYGRGNFRFGFRGAQLTFLDSASATLSPIVYDWLDDWIVDGRDLFHVVLMHIPPLDPAGVRNGAFASRNEAHALIGALARGGVDLTLYGHLHTYIAYANAGIPAFISGGGGAIPERFDGVGRHYLTVDVDPATDRFQTAIVRID